MDNIMPVKQTKPDGSSKELDLEEMLDKMHNEDNNIMPADKPVQCKSAQIENMQKEKTKEDEQTEETEASQSDSEPKCTEKKTHRHL